MSNSQLINKLKCRMKNGTDITLITHQMWLLILTMRLIFHIKLLLIDIQVSRLCKAFENNWSINIKLSKTQLSKIEQ